MFSISLLAVYSGNLRSGLFSLRISTHSSVKPTGDVDSNITRFPSSKTGAIDSKADTTKEISLFLSFVIGVDTNYKR